MRTRLILAFALVIVAALGTVLLVAHFSTEAQVRGYLRRDAAGLSDEFIDQLREYYQTHSGWEGVSDLFTRTIVTNQQGQGKGPAGQNGSVHQNTLLTDTAGVIQYASESARIGTQLSEPSLQNASPLELNNQTIGYLIVPNAFAALPNNFEAQLIKSVQNATLTAALVSGVVAILLAVALAYQVVRPINTLTHAAEKMAGGDLDQRVQIRSYPEVNMLGNTLNSLAQNLQSSESNRKAMTADIAHELRTPLAVQKVNLEALEDGVYPLNMEALKPIREQNELLIRLVEDLRTLALADSGELTLNKRSVDLMVLCDSTVQQFEASLRHRGIHVEKTCEGVLPPIFVDPDRIQQILHNLMQNTQRYAPANTAIEMRSKIEGKMVLLEIRDHGPGIPSDQLEKVFERFYRFDDSRERANGSTGLGLSIARKLAEAHGGSLTAGNHTEGGAVFSLRLPV